MTQEQINKAAEDFAKDLFHKVKAGSHVNTAVWYASLNGFKAGAALMQPEIERLKELVERYENALKSFGQSLTT